MAIGQEIYMFIMCFMLASVCFNKAFGRPKREVDSSIVSNECVSLAVVNSNITNESYSEAIADLAKKADGLYINANIVKRSLLTEYGSMYLSDPAVTGSFDSTEFMDRIGMLDITSPVEQAIEELKLHYKVLHEHIAYVNATRTHGNITTLFPVLLGYQSSLHRCLCSVRIALIAAGYTEQVSKNVVVFNKKFETLSGTEEHRFFRAYIVIEDGLVLSSNLKEAYRRMLV